MSDVVKNLLKYFPDLVILTDLKGNIIDLSQSVLDLYKIKEKKEFIGKKPHTMIFLTKKGRTAFEEYRKKMKQFFDDMSS